MDSTRKKLLVAVAVFYGGFLIIRLPPILKEWFTTTGETEKAFYTEIIEYNFPLNSMMWWDYLSVAMLIIAVGLTFAVFQMRNSKSTHLKF